MHKTIVAVIAVCAVGCASTPSPVPKTPTPVVPVQATEPQEAEVDTVPQAKGVVTDAMEMSYSLPDAEDWTEGDRRAVGFEGWTPDAVIRNQKLGATMVFAGYPANMGSTLDVADSLRASFAPASNVTAEATGRFASFVFCKKRKRAESERVCGKTYVVRVPGDRNQYVLIVGTWPESSNEEGIRDIDTAARSFAAQHSQ